MKTRRSSSTIELLLLEDIDGLGRKGELVKAKPGHARNYIVPKRKGVVADMHTLRMQERLKEERTKQAVIDRQEAEQLASQISGLTCEVTVKVDPEGHMYGSVSAQDMVDLLAREGMKIERKHLLIGSAIKETGLHTIKLGLKEGVTASFKLNVVGEGVEPIPQIEEEAVSEEGTEDQQG